MGTPKKGGPGSDEFSSGTKRAIAAAGGARRAALAGETSIGRLAQAERMLDELLYLAARGDGWMRWSATSDQKTIYLKYKFTSYLFPNHYVMVSGPLHDIALLVSTLVLKCERVDAGTLLPTPDHYYNDPNP